jgi:hypothetical protein
MIFCAIHKFRIFFYIKTQWSAKQNIFCRISLHTFCIETLLPKPLSGRACLPAAPLSISPQAVTAAMGAVALRTGLLCNKTIAFASPFPARLALAPWHSGAQEPQQQTASEC